MFFAGLHIESIQYLKMIFMEKSRFKPTNDDMSQILEIGLGWAVDNGMATEDDRNMT